MNEMLERLDEVAEKSFDDFKNAMLEKTKEEIFAKNYEIRFFEEMKEFFSGYGSRSLKEHTVKILVSIGKDLLNTLYKEFLCREYASINSWDDICMWLEIYAENLEV